MKKCATFLGVGLHLYAEKAGQQPRTDSVTATSRGAASAGAAAHELQGSQPGNGQPDRGRARDGITPR